MAKRLVTILSISLSMLHMILIYLWLIDWKTFASEVGFISWLSSILLGLIALSVYRKTDLKKERPFPNRLVKSSTSMVAAIGIVALLIEGISDLLS